VIYLGGEPIAPAKAKYCEIYAFEKYSSPTFSGGKLGFIALTGELIISMSIEVYYEYQSK